MYWGIVILLFSAGYAGLMFLYLVKWRQVPEVTPLDSVDGDDLPFISIIVPARNEEENIEACVNSLLDQEYPQSRFEIIIVDDHSDDRTAEISMAYADNVVSTIKLSEINFSGHEQAFKKRGIEVGVNASKGSIIVTTDADCTHSRRWLRVISNAFLKPDTDMVTGPVLFRYDKSIFQKFQALDFLGMAGITAASLEMGMYNLANGANLAFRKAAFERVEGYRGIDNKASGDDMLLIYKIAGKKKDKVKYLKSEDAAVFTRPAAGLREFIHQRLRWTSKSFSYQDRRITLILAFVYLVNAALPISLILYFLTGSGEYLFMLALQFVIMSLSDVVLLNDITLYFRRRDLLKTFLPSQLLHVVYIVVIGLAGNIVNYDWKGRRLR